MVDIQTARAPTEQSEKRMVRHVSYSTTDRGTFETAFGIRGLSR